MEEHGVRDSNWREDLAHWPAFAPHFHIDAAYSALVIIDMQNGYVRRESGIGEYLCKHLPELATYYFDRHASEVIPNIVRLLSFFRQHQLPVLHVTFGAQRSDALDWLPSRRRVEEELKLETGHVTAVLIVGTPEHDIISELMPKSNELVLNKVTRSAFNSTGIDQILRNMGVKYLVTVGCITNVCVETTARDAVDLGYQCVVVEDATASFNPIYHHASLRAFAANFGMVLTTGNVVADLEEGLGCL